MASMLRIVWCYVVAALEPYWFSLVAHSNHLGDQSWWDLLSIVYTVEHVFRFNLDYILSLQLSFHFRSNRTLIHQVK